jgi:hypothetical protein
LIGLYLIFNGIKTFRKLLNKIYQTIYNFGTADCWIRQLAGNIETSKMLWGLGNISRFITPESKQFGIPGDILGVFTTSITTMVFI